MEQTAEASSRKTAGCVKTLPDVATARETGNASRTTMNEGIVGALRCNDTAAGIQAGASPYVEDMKWRPRRNRVRTASSAYGASDAHSTVFSCTGVRTLSSQKC
jgi:hypothetical protein